MWCNVCQSDVAIEVGADHRRVTCSTCGTVLGETAVSRENDPPTSATQGGRVTEARDLLDRWASDHLFDPYGPPKKPVSADQDFSDQVSAEAAPQQPAADNSQTARPAPPDRLEDLLDPPPASAVRPRWDAPHTNVRRPMNLNRRDEGLRGSRPAEQSGGGVAETSRRPQPPASQRPSQPPSPPRTVSADPPAAGSAEGVGLAASAAELDRLTNEILSRVSRITNQRAAEPPTVSDDHAAQDDWQDEAPRETIAADEYETTAEAESQAGLTFDGESPAKSGDAWNLAPASQPASPEGDDEPGIVETDEPALNNAVAEKSARAQQRVPRPHAAAFTQRVDAPHEPSQPHADFSYGREHVAAAVQEDSEEDAANWFSGIGQGLAWLGILGLTAGTSLVIVGYMGGGPPAYAPTGWLISTIGQMLLFLGIVTLVSSGMEQTTQEVRRTVNEVSRKLDLIEDRIIRIDAAAPPGPPRPHIADRMVKATSEQQAREEAARR